MFKNYTPHPVTICDEDGNIFRAILPEETPIRLSQQTVPHSLVDGIQLTITRYGAPVDLPEAEEGVWLIVSQMVFDALPQRADLCVPAELVRDDIGNIIGCRSLGVR